jgi:hypothetical protein
LYGCIESARLWNTEISGTLKSWGFIPNPRDPCVMNKIVKGKQITVVVYVDDLLITCVYDEEVKKLIDALTEKYGQFRSTTGLRIRYLGCVWDFSEEGFVLVSQTGFIQELVTRREATLAARGQKLQEKVLSPGASYLFERSNDSPLLNDKDRMVYHTDVATAAYAGQRTRGDINAVIGELSKRVRAPTEEDDKKLNRLISYLKATRDVPLRLGCDLNPTITVSIDAAFANRESMKSTSGMCVTLGTGFFITSSKVQKINSKSSTEAEIIAVSDGMNLPLWLMDFIKEQGHEKCTIVIEQDNQSAITLLTKGRSTSETTRFIAIRYYWINQYILNKVVKLVYVPTDDMIADYFTKPLQGARFKKMVKKILGRE